MCIRRRKKQRHQPLVGSGGVIADGADIALFDVEAVDAKGDRVPTFQQKVDFNFTGPGTWRDGYNSGKINSTNHTSLDLEAGINRVAVRAGRTPGKLTLTARSEGLEPASISVESVAYAGALPTVPAAKLSAQPVRIIGATITTTTIPAGTMLLGKFIKTLNYTAPNAFIVHVEIDARDGKNAYVNIAPPLPLCPPRSKAPTGCRLIIATHSTARWI